MRFSTERHASELGVWTYHERRPAGLADFVELVWQCDGKAAVSHKRVLPNGRLELLVNLGSSVRLVEGAGCERLRSGWLSGLQQGPLVIEMGQVQRVLGVRLRPAGARALLGLPLSEVSDRTLDLPDVVGRAADELAGGCRDASTPGERFLRAEAWVAERLRRNAAPDAAVVQATDRLEQSAGRLPIARVRDAMGLSRARLAEAFRDQVGATPKRYARIQRLRRATRLLHERALPLAEVAVEAGFYDHSHLTSEFRRLTGLSPRAYREGARYPASLALAEAPGEAPEG